MTTIRGREFEHSDTWEDVTLGDVLDACLELADHHLEHSRDTAKVLLYESVLPPRGLRPMQAWTHVLRQAGVLLDDPQARAELGEALGRRAQRRGLS